MNRKLFAVAVSLLIVMQCICTPISYALQNEPVAEGPVYNLSGDAVPILSTLAANGTFAGGHYETAYIGYGYPPVGEDDYPGSSSRRFQQEIEGTLSLGEEQEDITDGAISLPTADALARVPDMEFEGWYVYGGNGAYTGNTGDATIPEGGYLNGGSPTLYRTWTRAGTRDTSNDIDVNTLLEDPPGEDTYPAAGGDGVSTLIVNADTARSLLERLVESYAVNRLRTYHSRSNFPLVGGWKASSDATMVSAALKTDAEASAEQLYKYADTNPTATLDALEGLKVGQFGVDPEGSGGSITEYYLRVDADTESLMLEFTAYEPYLAFQSANAVVSKAESTGTEGGFEYTYWDYTYDPIVVEEISASATVASPVSVKINGEDYSAVSATAGGSAAQPSLTYDAVNDGYYRETYLGSNTAAGGLQSAGWISENSAADPARSVWTLTNIPLETATEEDPCNIIEVSITSPDGSKTEIYRFYIQRVKNPEAILAPGNTPAGMIERDFDGYWGSTESEVAANKADWLDFFKNNPSAPSARVLRNRIDDKVYYIRGQHDPNDTTLDDAYDPNNGGRIYDRVYTQNAWQVDLDGDGGNDDLDLDRTAVVAYQNYAFTDPGFDIYMSSGNIYQSGSRIERRIALDVPAEGYTLLEALVDEGEKLTTMYYTSGGLVADDTWEEVTADSLGVDLTDKLILPGTYEIEYRFADPYTGEELEFSRPLVVLAIPGDVDMDGVTTVADAYALSYLYNADEFTNPDPRMALFGWRVCEIAGDENINTADIAALENGWRPELSTMRAVSSSPTEIGVSDYMYLPLEDPASRYDGREKVASTANLPELKLEYEEVMPVSEGDGETASVLLVERPSRNVMEPPQLNTGEEPVLSDEGIAVGDVFWVDVTVKALEGYTNITAFTHSLSYDTRYVRPATLDDLVADLNGEDMTSRFEGLAFDDSDLDAYADYLEEGKGADWAAWAAVVEKYNLRGDAGTPWAGEFVLTLGSRPVDPSEYGVYSTHFSKAVADLESTVIADGGKLSDIGELIFSIKLAANGTPASLSAGGTLLSVPFIMHEFPDAYEGREMSLVSLNLGMQEFTTVSGRVSNTTDTADDFLSQVSVSAFSARTEETDAVQEGIYGGVTSNLRSKLGFTEMAPGIQIAADNRPYTPLENTYTTDITGDNARYGAYFETTIAGSSTSMIDRGELPPGLSFGTGTISGTPTRAGVYRFEIGNGRYEITVEKIPLEIYALGAESYYGEEDYTDIIYSAGIAEGEYIGFAAGELTYELKYAYDPASLIASDASRIGGTRTDGGTVANDGDMRNLPYLISVRDGDDLRFAHPNLTSGRTKTSDVDEYPVSIDIGENEGPLGFDGGMLENYYFVVTNDPNDEQATRDVAYIEVLPRPIIVDKFNFDTEPEYDADKLSPYRINDNENPTMAELQSASIGSELKHFDTKAAQGARESGDGRYLHSGTNLPLSAEGVIDGTHELSVEFVVTFQRNESDSGAGAGKTFYIATPGATEPRDIQISDVALAGGADMANYTLDSDAPTNGLVDDGGLVSNIEVVGIGVRSWAAVDLNLDFGDQLWITPNNFIAYIDYGDGAEQQNVPFGGTTEFNGEHMYLSLVTEARMNYEIAQLAGGGTVNFGTAADGVVVDALENGALLDANTDSDPETEDEKYFIRVAYIPAEAETLADSVIYHTTYSSMPDPNDPEKTVPQPLIVNKLALTLYPDTISSYYGETVTPSYTFTVQGLAQGDKEGIVPDSDGRASGDVLAEIFKDDGWTPPKMRALAIYHTPTAGDLESAPSVTKTTPYTNTDFYVVIHGAEHKNYEFRYQQTSSGAASAIDPDFGYTYGRIEQRPIVLKSMPDKLGDVYSDIYSTTVNGWEYTVGRSAGLEFALPSVDVCYEQGAQGGTLPVQVERRRLSGTAIVEGDDIRIFCSVTLLQENAQWRSLANGYFNMRDDSGAILAERPVLAALGSVTLDPADPDYERNINYRLVYESYSDVTRPRPLDSVLYYRNASTDGKTSYVYSTTDQTSAAYNVAGNVTVHTREAVSLEVVGAPNKTSYVYGEKFNPAGLTVRLRYENKYGAQGELPVGAFGPGMDDAVIGQDALGSYVDITYDHNGQTSSFDDYGLTMLLNGKPVAHNEYITPAGHNGKITVIFNSPSGGGNVSGESSFSITVSKRTLTLNVVDQHRYFGEPNYSVRFVPGTDTAPGDAVYEYWFSLTGPAGSTTGLAEPDLEALRSSGQFADALASNIGFGYADKDDNGVASHNDILTFLGGYAAPTFSTSATATSGAGDYPLTLTDGAGGFADNYTFNYVDSRIYVYPRPIKVTGFYAGYTGEDGTDRSIYSLFTETTGQLSFTRTIPYFDAGYNTGTVTPQFIDENGTPLTGTAVQPGYIDGPITDGWQWFKVENELGGSGIDNTYTMTGLPSYARLYLSGGGIVTNGSGDLVDNPYFTLQATFESDPGTEKQCRPVRVTVEGIEENGSNYLLVPNTLSEDESTQPARVEVRTINSITVFSVPNKPLASYVYGGEEGELDLEGLQIQIVYDSAVGEEDPPTALVSYTDDLRMFGLYLNYYPGETITESEDEYSSIITKYRSVQRDEHLTIAPVHDSAADASLPQYGEFAHNGMHIVVSAQRPESEGGFVEPKLIRMRGENQADPGAAQKIVVAPRLIEYTLAAENKDYDGTTRAVGSITFDNVHPGDLIYAATGEDYEGVWTWRDANGNTAIAAKRTALQGKASAGYTYSSGAVDRSGLNSVLSYTAGSWAAENVLRFEFADENANYDYTADTVSNIPLSVTDIILGGPDAANYTFTRSVYGDHDTEVASSDPAAPRAVIERASYDTAWLTAPALEIDDTTGVVRVLYNTVADEKVLSARAAAAEERLARVNKNEPSDAHLAEAPVDDYADELHIEYAIEYFLPERDALGGITGVPVGSAAEYIHRPTDSHWTDTYYFGGEAVNTLYDGGGFYPAGFVSEETEPEEYAFGTELFGQLYKWTAYDAEYDENDPNNYYNYTYEGASSTVPLKQYLAIDEDDNLVPRETEWLFDDGFTFHVQDPSIGARTVEIGGTTYYYFYGYYTTERSPIPRGAYILGKVRLAATHNYEASGAVYSANYDGTQGSLDALVSATDAVVDAYNTYLTAVAEDSREDVTPVPPEQPGDMLRMYAYRLDLRAAEDTQSAVESDDATYDLRTLRAVKFTDYTPYSAKEQFDAVLHNDVNGFYSNYYWDDRYQNAIEFDEDNPIYLGVPFELEVTREGRVPEAQNETFNSGDTIPIYVSSGGFYNPMELWIDVLFDGLTAYAGDEPFDLSTLTVEFFPRLVSRMEITWTSSDESVVRVTEDGFLEFVGPGTAIITATSFWGRTDTFTVTVLEPPDSGQIGVFNRRLLAEFMGVDEDYFFYPEREMTRGEFVTLAAMFFIANDEWERFEDVEFIDIVGDEPYAEAVALLAEWGIIIGVGESRFAGERFATRAEAAAIIARMLGIDPDEYLNVTTFKDSKPRDTWAAGYIAALKSLGATNGIGHNLFAPNRNITRAEAAAMFARLLEYRTPALPLVIPVDVPANHWAFGLIVRALNDVILPAETEAENDIIEE